MKSSVALTFLGVAVSLSSAFYLGQTDRPFEIVGVRFCPETANRGQKYVDSQEESQYALDKRFCRHEVKMLKRVWEQKQLESSYPLPMESLKIRVIPPTDYSAIWFLVAPVSMGISYLAWAKKCEEDEMNAHLELEGFKTQIKLVGVSARNERDFKSQTINTNWDKQRVKAGFISVDAIQDRLRRQTEITNKQHEAALNDYSAMIAELQKKRDESLRDAAKARKETKKYSDISDTTTAATQVSSDKELVNQLVEALKSHEDGWLWTVIKAVKPLWIIGEQGTGKTNTAVAIALIRKHCLDVPIYRIADRHMNGANSKAWKLLDAQVKADNDSAIIEALQDTYERRLERIGQDLPDNQSEQFLLDEFTHLKDIDSETVKRFIKSTFSDTRKAKERFVGVTHLGTNEAFGDGTAAMRQAGSILIEKFTVDGERPLPRVVVRHGLVDDLGNKLEDVEKSLPGWFEANKIYNHFNGKPIDFET